MELAINRNKKIIIDAIYFWGFWIVLTGLFVGIIEKTIVDALKAVLALIIPHILPAFLISLLFDYFFVRKKYILFFLLSVPTCIICGWLINIWFNWLMEGTNIQANNIFLLLIFTFMYVGFNHIRLAISQKIILKDEENKRVLTELQYLRAQLNPHFLFNALNSIYSLILSKSDKAGEAVMALSEIMRFHIDLSGKQLINLADEIALIQSYMELEKLKLETRCEINFKIKGEARNIKIAPLILMPFIENAFKHGISSNPKENFVHLQLVIEDAKVSFEISNWAEEKAVTENKRENKLGIENTLKRLELHYNGNYTFKQSVTKGVYLVRVFINLNK